jgi:glycosyltransferase involved in cell wall biosynthesis
MSRHAAQGGGANQPARAAGPHTLRILIVQHKGDSAEAKVVHTWLTSLQGEPPDGLPPRVLVVQFGHERLAYGKLLQDLPGVAVMSVDIGGSLGVEQPRWRMLVCLLRLLLALPAVVIRTWRFHPSAIYTSQQRWDVRMAMLLSAVTRSPHVLHLHYVPGPWLGKDVLWRLTRCQRVICVSDFIRGLALRAGVPAGRCVTIRNVLATQAVAITRSSGQARTSLCHELVISSDDVLVGMVARMDRGKGQLELVQAMAPLLTKPDAHTQLILAGAETYPEQGYANEVLQCAQRLGIEHAIHWLGPRSDVPTLLHAFDVFAHPSFDEPCPLAVIEALLAGLPCVGWRDGGQAELIKDQETGLLVETGNLDSLTEALAFLCAHSEARARMAAAAHADAARLSDTLGAARALSGLFEEVVDESGRHRPVRGE